MYHHDNVVLAIYKVCGVRLTSCSDEKLEGLKGYYYIAERILIDQSSAVVDEWKIDRLWTGQSIDSQTAELVISGKPNIIVFRII